MEQENKVLSELGLFGITCLAILVFCSLSFCFCFTIHVRWIYTVICPLLSIVNCVSSCLNKFRVRHKEKPTNISDIEGRILNSKSAKKVGRRTGQSILLRDLQTVSPRLTDFFYRLRSSGERRFLQKELWTKFSSGAKKTEFWTATDPLCRSPPK